MRVDPEAVGITTECTWKEREHVQPVIKDDEQGRESPQMVETLPVLNVGAAHAAAVSQTDQKRKIASSPSLRHDVARTKSFRARSNALSGSACWKFRIWRWLGP